MKRYWWWIIAAVCILALIVVGVIFIPPLLETGTDDDPWVKMIPAHWWKADLTAQQMETIASLWGREVTPTQLLQALWPEALQQMPEEASSAWEGDSVHWPPRDFEDWNASMISGGVYVPHDQGTTKYSYYLGSPESEMMILTEDPCWGLTEDRMYRVSLYTDVPEGVP